MLKFYEHLKTINNHKRLVMEHCFKCGLYTQGLLHDLSKYSPTEFIVGAMYWTGKESPNNVERRKKGYTSAWLHHKGRNKHHLEYWIDYGLNGEGMTGMRMPTRYVVEMFCDRVAASKNYNLDTYDDTFPLKYYLKGKYKYMMHPDTAALLEKLLTMLSQKGEDYTFSYIRKKVLGKPFLSDRLIGAAIKLFRFVKQRFVED